MTEKAETITLHHSSDPKLKVTTNADHAQAYLQSGWVEKSPESDTK
jgi:hypothetical protein